jgi:two-component system chemotaxis sensor kinase CheA
MLPGFSTAQEVSSLSGRGVGLDVVKKKVQDLRGKLDIQSIEGKGTTMTITLPLTLAIIDGMVIKVGQQRYILPLTFIERILRPQVENFFTIQGKGEVIMVEEDPIPIIRLYEIWNVQPEKKNLWEGLMVIVGDGKRKGGLFVDDLLEQQQVVIKELGDLKGLKGISGGTILGNGTVGLILDVAGILEMAFQA